MMSLGEYRSRAALLSDFLPWAALVEKGVVLNKDGSFQRTARIRGPDLDSATPAELVGVTGRLNNALRRLGSGWAVFVEAQRVPATVYPDSDFPDAASHMVDLERREQFEDEGAHFESRYFLTLVWLPPAESSDRAARFLYEGREREGPDPHGILNSFIDRSDRLLALLDGFMPEAAWLDDSETLTYLHSTISTRHQRVRVPEIPMHLDALLVDQPLAGGLEPKLGDAYLKTLTITGFPSRTFPGILDDLNRLAMPYRWSTRAILLDKTDATKVLTKIRRQWFAKRKSIAAIVREVMTNEASVLMDNDAANKAADADLALQSLGADDVGQTYLTATITVWDGSASIAAEKLRLVEKIIQGRDFTCMAESLNAVEAWLGSLPGHVYANVRQPPVSTLNLAHMIPLSAVWAGPEQDGHFRAAPLFYGRTAGATPFRFSLHVGDVGHTLIAGPTGAGKSVLLALMALQFRRYAGSEVFAFDFGGSILAVQLFVALIEFKLTTLAGFILIPFALFNRTAFLAEKVLGNVVSSGVKIMVLAVISAIASVLFAQFATSYGSDVPTIGQAVSVVLASLSIVGLAIYGGSIANGLISGAPQLGAGAAVGTGMAVGAMGAAAVAAPAAAISGGAAALGATAAAARGGAAIAGAANTAYSMGAMNAAGGSAGARMAAGLGGVARAPGSAAANAVKSKMSSAATAMKQSYDEGARRTFTATGGRFTGGSSSDANGGQFGGPSGNGGGPTGGGEGGTPDGQSPRWAQKMKRRQAATHAAEAAHVIRSADGGGGSSFIDLSEKE